MHLTHLLSAVVLTGTGALAFAGDVDSGPAKGAKVPPLKVHVLSGPLENKEIDFPAERKDKATVYVLVNAEKFLRPQNKFLVDLGKAVGAKSKDAHVVAVWLTEDEDKTKKFLPIISKYHEGTSLAFVTAKDKQGPKDWAINFEAEATVVIAYKGKVAARFGYNSVNDTLVREVMGALEKATKE